MRRTTTGFTLIELMIVIAIVGILASIAMPEFRRMQCKAKQREVEIMSKAIKTMQTGFINDFGALCPDSSAVTGSGDGEPLEPDTTVIGMTTCVTEDGTTISCALEDDDCRMQCADPNAGVSDVEQLVWYDLQMQPAYYGIPVYTDESGSYAGWWCWNDDFWMVLCDLVPIQNRDDGSGTPICQDVWVYNNNWDVASGVLVFQDACELP